MMPKCDTIDAIRRLNPTADTDFLAEFSNDELAEYLDRLTDMPAARCACVLADPVELEEFSGIDVDRPPVVTDCRR